MFLLLFSSISPSPTPHPLRPSLPLCSLHRHHWSRANWRESVLVWSAQSVMWPQIWLFLRARQPLWRLTGHSSTQHTWQAGRAALLPPLSNNPLLRQKNAGATLISEPPRCPGELAPESGLLQRERDFKNEEPVYGTLGKTMPTPPLSALLYHRDGEMSEAHMAREQEEKEEEEEGKMRWRKNRQSWRTDRLLGKAFCHKRTPPPKRPSPVIQAFSVKDTQTDSPEKNLVSRLSQLSSRLIEASHGSSVHPSSPVFFPSPLQKVWVKDLPLANKQKHEEQLRSENPLLKKSYECKCCFMMQMYRWRCTNSDQFGLFISVKLWSLQKLYSYVEWNSLGSWWLSGASWLINFYVYYCIL